MNNDKEKLVEAVYHQCKRNLDDYLVELTKKEKEWVISIMRIVTIDDLGSDEIILKGEFIKLLSSPCNLQYFHTPISRAIVFYYDVS